MKHIILLSFLSALSLGARAQEAQKVEPQTTVATEHTNGPKFGFKEETYDFKKIPEGPVAEHVFKFKNTGKEPLIIQSASASCGCTKPEWPAEPIKPGKTGKITVRYNTKGRIGAFTKDVYIYSNAIDGQPKYTIHITGNVEAAPVKADTKDKQAAAH